MKAPKLYKKQDDAYYFTFNGKQHYAGKTLEKAGAKLKKITGAATCPQSCLVAVVGEYLDSIHGTQADDTVYQKALSYGALLTFLSGKTNGKPSKANGHGRRTNGSTGPGMYSLHASSTVTNGYTSHVAAFETLFPESIALAKLTFDNLEKYRKSRLKTSKKSTVKTDFIRIRALCKWLYDNGSVTENPCAKLSPIKVFDELDPDHLTEEEVDRLFELVDEGTEFTKVRDKLIFGLMIYAGLRRIECTRIKWTDVDLKKRVIVVRNGKGGKHRLVAINDKLGEVLKSSKRYGSHIVTSQKGKPVTRAALTRVAQNYVKKLNHHYQGNKRFSLHALRATFATRLCEKGVSTRIVQGLLGHSDPKTTLRYAAVSEAAAIDAVQRL